VVILLGVAATGVGVVFGRKLLVPGTELTTARLVVGKIAM